MAGHMVCILSETDARSFTHGGIAHRCSSRRHRHMPKAKVETLVRAGELSWLGKHRKIATWRSYKTWAKVYNRNAVGEVLITGLQLVSGARR